MAAKLDKNSKELVQDLLKLQGVEYIDWLNKKHQEVITKNTKIIRNLVLILLNFYLTLQP